MVIAGTTTGILDFLHIQIFGSSMDALVGSLPPEVANQLQGLADGGLGIWSMVLTPLLFVIGVVPLHTVAKALAGLGEMGGLSNRTGKCPNHDYRARFSILSRYSGDAWSCC